MRKIQLTDFSPSSIRRQQQPVEVIKLVETIKKACIESNLSYSEINKALYLSDQELYKKAIKLPISAEKTETEARPFITGTYECAEWKDKKKSIVPPPVEEIEVAPVVDGLYSAIKGLEFTKNEPIRMSISGNELKYEFNFNGLSQEKIFDLVNDVVNSSINQLINLKKEKSHQAALEEIELTIKEMAKEKDIYKRRVNSLVATLCHSELEKRMKNSPVK